MMTTIEKLYLEDIEIDQVFTSGTETLSANKIKEFAREYDPQPFHLDESSAKDSLFQGLAASGWQTAGITMRLLVLGGFPVATGLIGVDAKIIWPKPTRPDDILKVITTVIDIKPSRSKLDRGIVTIQCNTLNQHNSTVQAMTTKLVIMRRKNN